jgi:ElaB/YqjD/DUF883 family membrane-anchored ribosome-binding protein
MTNAERRELRDDLKDEIEEIDADLVGIMEEIREAKERLVEAKARKAAALEELRALRAG